MANRSRLIAATVGLLIGLAGSGTLAWNEYHLARQLDAVAEARAGLAQAGTDMAPAVVHLVGTVTATAPVTDPAFGLTTDALRLDRTAETYQWLETRESSGDNKLLRYEKIWSPVLIPSDRFEQRSFHPNPRALRLTTARFRTVGATIDHDAIDPALIDALPAIRELHPEQGGPVHAEGLEFARKGDWLFSGDPGTPVVGDVRVRFAEAPEGLISLVAVRDGDRLVPFQSAAGGSVTLVAYGEVPAETLLHESARSQWGEAWQLRGFAAMAVLIGTLFAMPELTVRFAASPLFASRRRTGTMLLLAAGAAAVVCTISWLGARLLIWLATLAG